MARRTRIYIAGPLSLGDRRTNVMRAIKVMRELIEAGYAPFCPHLSHFADGTDQLGYDTWLDVDLAWVAVSDAVLRLPGESAGADRECELARRLRIPVYASIEELARAQAVVGRKEAA